MFLQGGEVIVSGDALRRMSIILRVAPNSLSFCFCLSLSNLTNYKLVAFRSLAILNSATFLSTNTANS